MSCASKNGPQGLPGPNTIAGLLEAGDRITLTGQGTPEDPFVITAYDPGSAKEPVYSVGNVTLTAEDFGRSFISTDSGPVNFFLPEGLPPGVISSFQGGSGQIQYSATGNASIVNGARRSAGAYTEGYGPRVRVESFGNNTYVVGEDTVEGLLEWSIVGPSVMKQGDAGVYVIWRPDSTYQFPSGVEITVTGTNMENSGFDQTLVQALANLAKLDPAVFFDGVDKLTILPSARNPLPLPFFAVPAYTATGNVDVAINISDPSEGVVASGAEIVETTVLNISKPTPPSELFPATVVPLAFDAASGQPVIKVADASLFKQYTTVVGTGIPALTYILSIAGNDITLSANLTAPILADTTVTMSPPGFHLDFSDVSTITKDGANLVSQVVDKIHGYPWAQATSGSRPLYVASSLNGQSGINFGAFKSMVATNPAVTKIGDEARAKSTTIVVGKLNAYSFAGSWIKGAFDILVNGAAFSQAATNSNSLLEVQALEVLGIPHIWSHKSDGKEGSNQVNCNGQRIYIPATVTSIAASGQAIIDLNDTSSLKTGMVALTPPAGGLRQPGSRSTVGATSGSQMRIGAINSGTRVTLNQNLVDSLVVGQEIYFVTAAPNSALSVAKDTTSNTLGSSSGGFNGVIYEIIYVPRVLSPQEWRGVHLYLSNKYATTINGTVSGAVAAGAKKIVLADVSSVRLYQTIAGTNIKAGTTVVKINTTTKEVWLDEAVQAGGLADGATLVFKYCGVKIPDLMDVAQFTPMFRDDFVNPVQLATSGTGWKPYYGDPSNPGTYNGAYGIYGHGSSNNGTSEKQWYLDVLNWNPWKQYTPFSQFSSPEVPKGGLVITARPTPAEIQGLVGYSAVASGNYPYISGYLRDAGGFNLQYGYWETRMKTESVLGIWAAFWLTATNGTWPPEIDIIEAYGSQPCSTTYTNHQNQSFDTTYSNRSTGSADIYADWASEYVLFGVEMLPDRADYYINREKMFSVATQWDMNTPLYMQLNMAVSSALSGEDMRMWVDYVSAWRRPDQVVTPSGTIQPETTAIVNAMTTPPSGAREIIINRMVEKLLLYRTSFGISLWTALDFLVVPAAHDAQAGRINWKNPAQVGTVVGSPTFTVDRGYSGTLGSAYVDMGFVLSAQSGYQLNTALNQSHVGAWAQNVTGSSAVACGTTRFNVNPRTGNSMGVSMWEGSPITGTTAAASGHYVGTRNHFQNTLFQNSALVKASGGDNNHTIDTDTLKVANGTARVAIAHAGDYLSPDDIRYYYAVFAEYLAAIGAI